MIPRIYWEDAAGVLKISVLNGVLFLLIILAGCIGRFEPGMAIIALIWGVAFLTATPFVIFVGFLCFVYDVIMGKQGAALGFILLFAPYAPFAAVYLWMAATK